MTSDTMDERHQMKITVQHACVSPDDLPFDTAERKGIGHPDSLADLIADAFSRRYAHWCLRQFGAIPNHWVDKVNLVGAAADVRFGGFDIRKPVDCYLFGKITDQVGAMRIPIEELFQDVVDEVLPSALGDGRILEHVRLHINNTRGTAVDHDAQFYEPCAADSISRVLATESVANDSVICVGAARRGLAAELAVALERRITGADFRQAFPAVGTDVKVMVVRDGENLDITSAIPIHPEWVNSWEAYRSIVDEAQGAVSAELKALLDNDARARGCTNVALHLNTKDRPGYGYLAPFGTSLGKGDCGAVGRGNRASGAIEPLRPTSCEAPAGKNPLHHVGKIYTTIAADAARRILADTGRFAEVTIVTRNGASLSDPAHVLVALNSPVDEVIAVQIERILLVSVADATTFTDRFLVIDPISAFREESQR
jgi:S-adenosylmethionine synthetase